jgi:anthranilate synthase component 1
MIPQALSGLRPYYRRLRGAAQPLEIYRRLYGGERFGFLYESLEQLGGRGRFSFVGGRPRLVFRSKGDRIELSSRGERRRATGDPLDLLRQLVHSGVEALPVASFPGGAVGYLGYDLVRFMAPVPAGNPDDLGLPDACFLFPEEVLIFDHLHEVVHLLVYGAVDRSERVREIAAEVEACEAGSGGRESIDTPPVVEDSLQLRSNMSREQFTAAVDRAKLHIRAGDIYQVVLSQRFDFPLQVSPLRLYSALRRTNPSPYMYFLNLDGLQLSGSSPEMLVKLTGRRVVTRPLAGTRPRGATPQEDRALAEELRADPKERAEHVMLVDLARNDVGHDCRVGTVQVDEYLEIERYAKGRQDPGRPGRVRRAPQHLPRGNRVGRSQDSRDADHRRTGTGPAGALCGSDRILQLPRRHGPLHRHSDDRLHRGPRLPPGRRGHRRRLRPGARVRGDPQQGAGLDRGDSTGRRLRGLLPDDRSTNPLTYAGSFCVGAN